MMMKAMFTATTVIAHILLALECIHFVTAESNGTAKCNSGMAAVDDTTVTYPNGTLSDAAIVFSINNVTLPGETDDFPSRQSLVWSIEAFNFAFTGFLVRFEAEEGNMISSNSSTTKLEDQTFDPNGLQISPVCAALGDNVEGVTHTTYDGKVYANGTIIFSNTGSVMVDVTVIFPLPEDPAALFAYDQFNITIVEGSDEPSASPSDTSSSIVPSSVPSQFLETQPPSPYPVVTPTVVPLTAEPATTPPVGVMDKCIKMGKGMSKDKGKGMSKGKGKGMGEGMGMMGKDKMDKKGKKGKKGEADDDSEEEEESDDGRLLKVGGVVTEDPCETEAPSDYPSVAPSAPPSDYPSASPTPEPTKGKGKMGMKEMGMGMKEMGMGDKKSKDGKGGMGDKKSMGGKGGMGKDKGEETEAPTDEPPEEEPPEEEPAPEEPKGKGGKGKGGKGETEAPETDSPDTEPPATPSPTASSTPKPTPSGKGGKGGKGGTKTPTTDSPTAQPATAEPTPTPAPSSPEPTKQGKGKGGRRIANAAGVL